MVYLAGVGHGKPFFPMESPIFRKFYRRSYEIIWRLELRLSHCLKLLFCAQNQTISFTANLCFIQKHLLLLRMEKKHSLVAELIVFRRK